MDMTGRTCLVTGANTGHGKAVALALAGTRATVLLGCRDPPRAEQTRVELISVSGNRRVDALPLDLASQRSIREAATTLAAKYPALDVLVNNAAAWWSDRRVSPDGVELVWATNVLGPQLLTHLLLPSLKASGHGRIVNVSSTFASGLDIDDVEWSREPYRGDKAYQASKQANRMLTWAWAKRLADAPVAINAISPGFMKTDLGRNAPRSFRAILLLLRPFQVSAQRGADTAVWLATSQEATAMTNQFVVGRKPVPCEFRDEQAYERLWQIFERRLSA